MERRRIDARPADPFDVMFSSAPPSRGPLVSKGKGKGMTAKAPQSSTASLTVADQRPRNIGLSRSGPSGSQEREAVEEKKKETEKDKEKGDLNRKARGPSEFPMSSPTPESNDEKEEEASKGGKENMKGGVVAGKGKGKEKEVDARKQMQAQTAGKQGTEKKSQPFPLNTPPSSSSRNSSTASKNASSSQSIVEISGLTGLPGKKGKRQQDEPSQGRAGSASSMKPKYTPAPTTARRPPPTNATQTTPPKRPKPNLPGDHRRVQGAGKPTASQFRQQIGNGQTMIRGGINSPSDDGDSSDPLAGGKDSPGKSSGIIIPSSPVVSTSNQRRAKGFVEDESDDAIALNGTPKEGGEAFFAEMSCISLEEETREGNVNGMDIEIDVGDLMGEGTDDDVDWEAPELSTRQLEERAYLEKYLDCDDLCPFCSEPLPLNPSQYLVDLGTQLVSLSRPAPTANNKNARTIKWAKATEYCGLHEAEATVIPMGLEKRYPKDIDFMSLEARLEGEWIRKELAQVAMDPTKSKWYNKCSEEMAEEGRLRWRSMEWQGLEHVRNRTMAGYYGYLGRSIIQQHLQNLVQWGCFPTLTPYDGQLPTSFPLTPSEFIRHVLAPEASLRLIMEDNGWVGEGPVDECARLSKSSRIMWEESTKYGSWKFRDETNEAKEVVEALRERERDTRRSAMKVRGVVRRKKGKPKDGTGSQPIMFKEENAPIDVSHSQRTVDSPDPPSTPIVIDSSPLHVLVATSPPPPSRPIGKHIPTPPEAPDSQDYDVFGDDGMYAGLSQVLDGNVGR